MMTLAGPQRPALEVDAVVDIDVGLVVGESDVGGWPREFAPRKLLRLRYGTCWMTWLTWRLEVVMWRKIAWEQP